MYFSKHLISSRVASFLRRFARLLITLTLFLMYPFVLSIRSTLGAVGVAPGLPKSKKSNLIPKTGQFSVGIISFQSISNARFFFLARHLIRWILCLAQPSDRKS